MEYVILKQDNTIHIYVPHEKGTYEHNSKRYNWMCSISKEENEFDWNDYFVPEIADMKLVLEVFNNFDQFYETAPNDYLMSEEIF